MNRPENGFLFTRPRDKKETHPSFARFKASNDNECDVDLFYLMSGIREIEFEAARHSDRQQQITQLFVCVLFSVKRKKIRNDTHSHVGRKFLGID